MYPFCIGVLPVVLKARMQVPEVLDDVSVMAGVVADVDSSPKLTPEVAVAGMFPFTCKAAVGAVLPMPTWPVEVMVIRGTVFVASCKLLAVTSHDMDALVVVAPVRMKSKWGVDEAAEASVIA